MAMSVAHPAQTADEQAPPKALSERKFLLGALTVAAFFAAWEAIFLFVPFDPLFISKPSLIANGFLALIESGQLLRELWVSALPFFYGFTAAIIVGVSLGVVMGWRARLGY